MLCQTLIGKQYSIGLGIRRRRWGVSCHGFLLTSGLGWFLELVRSYLPSVGGSQVSFINEVLLWARYRTDLVVFPGAFSCPLVRC